MMNKDWERRLKFVAGLGGALLVSYYFWYGSSKDGTSKRVGAEKGGSYDPFYPEKLKKLLGNSREEDNHGALEMKRKEVAEKMVKQKTVEITKVIIYPIKSCQGVSVQQAELTDTGFKHDRRWMVIDGKNRFLSQRRVPKMSLIKALDFSSQELRLSAPGMETLVVPVLQGDRARKVTVGIWDDTVEQACDQGDEVARWLQKFLAQPGCRLVYMSDDCIRNINVRYAVDETDKTSFSDGYPYLLISEESVEDLNQRMDKETPKLGPERFRPNMIIKGCSPYDEDCWKKLALQSGVEFEVVKPCSRCKMTTIDQHDPKPGRCDIEPLLTLGLYRQDRSGEVFLGQNLIESMGSRTSMPFRCVSVGDQIVSVELK